MASSDKSSFSAMNEDLYGNSTLGVGKFVIKAQYRNDIRRFPINQELMNLAELRLLLTKMFNLSIDNESEIEIKYRDEDNDLVTLLDDNDLSFALQESPKSILKLLITHNKPAELKVATTSNNVHSYEDVKEELVQILSHCNKLLAKFEQSFQPGPEPPKEQTMITAVQPATEAELFSTKSDVVALLEQETSLPTTSAARDTSELSPHSDEEPSSTATETTTTETNKTNANTPVPRNAQDPSKF